MRETTKELYHHGILGMKWGIRRYQNKDGSLTPAGKKRAAKMKDDYTKLTGKRLIRKPTKKAEPEKEDVRNKKIRDLTDTELIERINRLQKEKQLVGLETDLSGKGSKFVRSVGKDVVAPAAIDAGKRLLTNWLMKVGEEKLGLNVKDSKDALAELEREAKESLFKKQKKENDQWLKDYEEQEARKKEAKAAEEKAAKEAKAAEEKAAKEAKAADKKAKKENNNETDKEPTYGTNKNDWDFNTTSDKKTDPWSRFNNSETYDAVYEDISKGEDVVNRYNQLRLPGSK